jgi:endonuclease/exonuclease/phosphatase family metal-dependent hydrolase
MHNTMRIFQRNAYAQVTVFVAVFLFSFVGLGLLLQIAPSLGPSSAIWRMPDDFKLNVKQVNVLVPPSGDHKVDYAVASRSTRTRSVPKSIKRTRLRAMTFNIRHALGRNGEIDLEAVSETIRGVDPDIVALQEVDKFWPRSGFKDQTRFLAEALGYYAAFGVNLKIGPLEYGNAILSRYPILEAGNLALPSVREPRGCLGAMIVLPGGDLLTMYSLHLGLDKVERQYHARDIASYIGISETPVIVMGDYNTSSSGEEISDIRESLTDIYDVYESNKASKGETSIVGPIGSYRGSTFGFHRIDMIFSSQDITPLWVGPVWTSASDHFPVVGEIELGSDQ